MQYLENDMDELFRKAAEKYPLKTDSKDWNDIAPVLAHVSGAAHKPTKIKYTWLILLAFLIASIAAVITGLNHTSGKFTNPVSTNNVKEKLPADEKFKPDNTLTKEKSIRSSNGIKETGYADRKNDPGNSNSQKPRIIQMKNSATSFTNRAAIKTENYVYEKNTSVNTSINIQNGNPGNKAPIIPTTKNEIENNMLAGMDSSKRIAAVPVITQKQKTKQQEFYAAIVAGLQVNQVRGQGFTKPGLSAGILAGYRFSQKISVETGVLYSMKYYSSDGKYFNMSKAGSAMPANMTVINFTGASHIFEIPVKLKFDFLRSSRSNWFFTAGASSYILTHEYNDYFVLVNGVQQNLKGNYDHKKGYFSAAVNFSMGHEFNTRKQIKFRIEPYIQIPLKAIGIGSLQVMTTGLYIGVTNRLHK